MWTHRKAAHIFISFCVWFCMRSSDIEESCHCHYLVCNIKILMTNGLFPMTAHLSVSIIARCQINRSFYFKGFVCSANSMFTIRKQKKCDWSYKLLESLWSEKAYTRTLNIRRTLGSANFSMIFHSWVSHSDHDRVHDAMHDPPAHPYLLRCASS